MRFTDGISSSSHHTMHPSSSIQSGKKSLTFQSQLFIIFLYRKHSPSLPIFNTSTYHYHNSC